MLTTNTVYFLFWPKTQDIVIPESQYCIHVCSKYGIQSLNLLFCTRMYVYFSGPEIRKKVQYKTQLNLESVLLLPVSSVVDCQMHISSLARHYRRE